MADLDAPLTNEERAEMNDVQAFFCGGSGPMSNRDIRAVLAFARKLRGHTNFDAAQEGGKDG